MYNLLIFRFRQDLRTFDNVGLARAVKDAKLVLPVFIVDENLQDKFGKQDQRFLFIKEALNKLEAQLVDLGSYLYIQKGKPETIIPQLVKKFGADGVYANRSYGDYGTRRDQKISKKMIEWNKVFRLHKDFLLVEPHEVVQRKVFSAFYRKRKEKLLITDYGLQIIDKISSPKIIEKIVVDKIITVKGQNKYWPVDFAEKRIIKFDFDNYENTRNYPGEDGTSRLSPYIRFGLISIRQLYHHVYKCKAEIYIKELAWREFWQHINYYFPYTKELEFLEKRRGIKRENNKKMFELFCNGQTGYPIVDASIRQLKEENWMHGRCRMVVGSFLTKDLLIDWRWGEEFFAKYLLDYDENVNFGNWQWISSVGADPKPMRIFNPCLQSQKFDKNAEFIIKYISELKCQYIKSIHNPLANKLDYIAPIVNHYERLETIKKTYYNSHIKFKG